MFNGKKIESLFLTPIDSQYEDLIACEQYNNNDDDSNDSYEEKRKLSGGILEEFDNYSKNTKINKNEIIKIKSSSKLSETTFDSKVDKIDNDIDSLDSLELIVSSPKKIRKDLVEETKNKEEIKISSFLKESWRNEAIELIIKNNNTLRTQLAQMSFQLQLRQQFQMQMKLSMNSPNSLPYQFYSNPNFQTPCFREIGFGNCNGNFPNQFQKQNMIKSCFNSGNSNSSNSNKNNYNPIQVRESKKINY